MGLVLSSENLVSGKWIVDWIINHLFSHHFRLSRAIILWGCSAACELSFPSLYESSFIPHQYPSGIFILAPYYSFASHERINRLAFLLFAQTNHLFLGICFLKILFVATYS